MADVESKENPLLEKGDIYFAYRPRIGAEKVDDLSDVERFYMILKPWRPRRYRLIIIGRKKLPDPREHSRFWGFVWRVFEDREALSEELGPRVYETRTRGVRQVPAVRPAAEGIYAIVRHEDHTHLAYAIELPQKPGPAERAFNIEPEASYIIAVRNPATPRPPGTGLPAARAAAYPPELMEKFGRRRFMPVDPPAFLDHEGAEIIFIGAAEDPQEELGIVFRPDREDARRADILRDLKLPRDVPREPLFTGEWA